MAAERSKAMSFREGLTELKSIVTSLATEYGLSPDGDFAKFDANRASAADFAYLPRPATTQRVEAIGKSLAGISRAAAILWKNDPETLKRSRALYESQVSYKAAVSLVNKARVNLAWSLYNRDGITADIRKQAAHEVVSAIASALGVASMVDGDSITVYDDINSIDLSFDQGTGRIQAVTVTPLIHDTIPAYGVECFNAGPTILMPFLSDIFALGTETSVSRARLQFAILKSQETGGVSVERQVTTRGVKLKYSHPGARTPAYANVFADEVSVGPSPETSKLEALVLSPPLLIHLADTTHGTQPLQNSFERRLLGDAPEAMQFDTPGSYAFVIRQAHIQREHRAMLFTRISLDKYNNTPANVIGILRRQHTFLQLYMSCFTSEGQSTKPVVAQYEMAAVGHEASTLLVTLTRVSVSPFMTALPERLEVVVDKCGNAMCTNFMLSRLSIPSLISDLIEHAVSTSM
eukprot:m51a1_g11285 hypothetical protein (464) ;mRNA; r:27258-29268